ncbi:hypothetical protein D9M68_504100 [compost metagenome]
MQVYFLLFTLILFSCSNDQLNQDVQSTEVLKPVVVNPFPFYKSIEIKPGLHFEVLSWGKGVDSLGGYLILMSDSVSNSYKSISAERKGLIKEAWNMDLDNDGNPEIYIQYVVRKNVNDLQVYEFVNHNFEKISFPGLSSQLKDNYAGNDTFYVKEAALFRSIPLLKTDDTKGNVASKTLKYHLNANQFRAEQIDQ